MEVHLIRFDKNWSARGEEEPTEVWSTPFGEVEIGSCSAPVFPDGLPLENREAIMAAIREADEGVI